MISQIPPSTAAAPSAALGFRGADGPDGVLAGGRAGPHLLTLSHLWAIHLSGPTRGR
jgi:hypothetical protein